MKRPRSARRQLRPRARPEAVGPLVARVLADLGLDTTSRVMRVVAVWERVAGEEIARHCQPTALREPSATRGRVLEARVDSSVWCQQIRLRAPELLERLRAELGEDAPDELRLSVG